MIRRLFIYGPVSPEDAAAQTAWMTKLMPPGRPVIYRNAAVPMRLLLIDRVHVSEKRRDRVRLLPNALDEEGPPVAAIRAAMASGETLFHLRTGTDDGISAFSMTDAVFTVAFPDGEGVAWFTRVGSGIAPGIVNSCMWRKPDDYAAAAAARLMFFKTPPGGPAAQRQRQLLVAGFARGLLAEALNP